MDTSMFRPFRKPKVETAILSDTEEKPRFPSPTTKPKKRALKPIENPQPDPVETKLETAQPSSTSTAKGDGSSEIVASLDEKTRRVFEAIPSDRSISLDKLMALGYKVNELIAATTFLEIKGLINSLPGSLYIRK